MCSRLVLTRLIEALPGGSRILEVLTSRLTSVFYLPPGSQQKNCIFLYFLYNAPMAIRIEIQRTPGFVDASRFLEEQERIREQRQIPNRIRAVPLTSLPINEKNIPENLPYESLPPLLLPGLNPNQNAFLRLYLEGKPLKKIAEERNVDISYVSKMIGDIRKINQVPKGLRRTEAMEFLHNLIDTQNK